MRLRRAGRAKSNPPLGTSRADAKLGATALSSPILAATRPSTSVVATPIGAVRSTTERSLLLVTGGSAFFSNRCKRPARIALLANHRDERWVWFAESGCRLLKGVNQLFAEAWDFQFVPNSSFGQLFDSFRACLYLQNQPFTRALARVMASFASKNSAVPVSMSSILRQISVSHASATLMSAGPSKLATKSRASLARSRSDRVIAALVIHSSWA